MSSFGTKAQYIKTAPLLRLMQAAVFPVAPSTTASACVSPAPSRLTCTTSKASDNGGPGTGRGASRTFEWIELPLSLVMASFSFMD